MALIPPRTRGRSRLTIGLLVITSITVLTLDFRDVPIVADARHAIGSALSPLQGAADFVAQPFTNTWHGITDYGDVEAENEALRARVEELEGQLAQDADASVQLEAILEQIDIPWVGDIPTATAQVIQQPVSAFSHDVVIDKGASAGIRVGHPVVTGAGLIGQVIDVQPNRATVQLITDPEFRVGVRLVTSQRVGTAVGRGQGEDLIVSTGISPDEDAAKFPSFEVVTTSGIDERSAFPALIPVGQVTGYKEVNGGLNLDVSIRPLADLDELRFVDVLLRTPVE